MELVGVIFEGPEVNDQEFLETLPAYFKAILKSINGFIQFHGGLHVRGVCAEPSWHSIKEAWHGKTAFHVLYDFVKVTDIPFAQDCVGDQYFLRDGLVVRLLAEDGSIECLEIDLPAFFEAALNDPIEYLNLNPLLQFMNEGKSLTPGELIHVYPPFCTVEASNGVSMKAVPAADLLSFHASFAAHLPKDGDSIVVQITD